MLAEGNSVLGVSNILRMVVNFCISQQYLLLLCVWAFVIILIFFAYYFILIKAIKSPTFHFRTELCGHDKLCNPHVTEGMTDTEGEEIVETQLVTKSYTRVFAPSLDSFIHDPVPL